MKPVALVPTHVTHIRDTEPRACDLCGKPETRRYRFTLGTRQLEVCPTCHQQAKGGSKYHSTPTVVDRVRFDSAKEADRWQALRDRERAGEITRLFRQVRYALHAPGGAVVGHYVADFTYFEGDQGIVEDVKGYRTAAYRRSKKHLLAEYGIVIRET